MKTGVPICIDSLKSFIAAVRGLGLGFGVWGLGLRVWGLGLRIGV